MPRWPPGQGRSVLPCHFGPQTAELPPLNPNTVVARRGLASSTRVLKALLQVMRVTFTNHSLAKASHVAMLNLQGDGEAQSLTTCLRGRKLGSQQTFLPGDHRPLPHRDAMSIQCAEGNGDPGTQKAPNKCSAVFPITPRSQEIYALVSFLAVSLNGS